MEVCTQPHRQPVSLLIKSFVFFSNWSSVFKGISKEDFLDIWLDMVYPNFTFLSRSKEIDVLRSKNLMFVGMSFVIVFQLKVTWH